MTSNDTGLSVVIPAFNEAAYLPVYLPTVLTSLAEWERQTGGTGEVIVVDNASTDATAQVAQQLGARVAFESRRNIGQVRNTGAAAATAPYLLFIDADVAIPLGGVTEAMQYLSEGCAGGAIPPVYRCRRWGARLLCRYWDWYRGRHGGAQGVAQFCTAAAFTELGGYRTDLFMSEDVEFFARLRALSEEAGNPVVVLTQVQVEPSTRRYDRWPTWRMLWWQNPLTARMFLTSRWFWRHWYDSTVR